MSSTQYVVFWLGNEEYGIEIRFTKEIIRVPASITKMPNMPTFIEGIINLRGKIIPVIDLKKRFDFDQTERSSESRLLILDLESILLGIIIDFVSEVVMIDEESIQQLHSNICSIGNNNITGIGKIDDRLILLLDAIKLKDDVLKNY